MSSLSSLPTSLNAAALLSKLTEDEQLLLSKTMLSSRKTKFRQDSYTRITLLNNLSNIIILCETYQKKKNPRHDSLSKSVDRFKNEKWYQVYKLNSNYTHYNPQSAQSDFEQNLQSILHTNFSNNAEYQILVKIFLCTILIRNYLFHNYDVNLSFLSQPVVYLELFESAVFTLLFCLSY